MSKLQLQKSAKYIQCEQVHTLINRNIIKLSAYKSTNRIQTVNISYQQKLAALVFAGLTLATSAHATPTLDPLLTGAAPSSAGSGLSGTWYKVEDQARFSNYLWQEGTAPATAIKNFSWGTGIWSVGDVAAIASGQNPYVTATTTSVSAVSFANDIYNSTYSTSPWRVDGTRPVAPIVSVSGGGEENYAAVFTGYIYVAIAGIYDFGIFSDDGFSFSLLGANGSLQMSQDSVANSTGRDYYSLADENGLTGSLSLGVGYYGISLSYFNRLEAGVIDLGWTGPDGAWSVIGPENLYATDPTQVPEPASLALVALGLAGIWSLRRKTTRALA